MAMQATRMRELETDVQTLVRALETRAEELRVSSGGDVRQGLLYQVQSSIPPLHVVTTAPLP
jgi:hypothetical protein